MTKVTLFCKVKNDMENNSYEKAKETDLKKTKNKKTEKCFHKT